MFILIKKARIRLKLEKRNSATDFIKRKNKISNLNPSFIKKDNLFGRYFVISSQANLPRFQASNRSPSLNFNPLT